MTLLIRFLLLLSAGIAVAQDAPLYRLKANDQVRLTVFREPDLTATEQLTVAGEVSFPLIGSVPLLGLTLAEAEKLVTAKYDADYLVEPSLSINLISAADEVIAVLGAVNNPGQQNIPVNTTLDLVTAIDSAGGLAAHADPKRLELKREGETLTFELSQLRAADAEQVILKHGDRINVPASPFANKTVTILGEVGNPGTEAFPISGELTLDLLIANRGDLTGEADRARITIKRNGKFISGLIGRGQALLPGDQVTIPPSRFVGKFVNISGPVARPGQIPFPLDGRLSLVEAIDLAGDFTKMASPSRKVKLSRTVRGSIVSKTHSVKDILSGKEKSVPLQPGDRIEVIKRFF